MELQVGDEVIWAKRIPGGDYVVPISAVVLGFTDKRVKIAADDDGEQVIRHVPLASLQRLQRVPAARPRPPTGRETGLAPLAMTPLPVPLHAAAQGTLRVGDTPIGLDLVLAAHHAGRSPEEIVEEWPALALGDVYAVLAFYLYHQEAVDAYLSEQQQVAGEGQPEIEAAPQPSPLRARLEGWRARLGR